MIEKLKEHSTGIGIILGGGAGFLVASLTNFSAGLSILLGAFIGMLIGISR